MSYVYSSDIKGVADAINNLAEAYRERTARMLPSTGDEPRYSCEKCGSPKWEPGGNCGAFRKCRDCGHIGEAIDNAE